MIMEDGDKAIWLMGIQKVCEGPEKVGQEVGGDVVQLNKHLYWSSIGGLQRANLAKLGIKHILSLSSHTQYDNPPAGIKMHHVLPEGQSNYRLLFTDFPKIKKIYLDAVERKENIVITDVVGVNRSAMVCGGLLMTANNWKLLDTFTYLSDRLGIIVQVPALQSEVFDFAVYHGLLDEVSRLTAIEFNEDLDMTMMDQFRDDIVTQFDPALLNEIDDDDPDMRKERKNQDKVLASYRNSSKKKDLLL